MRGSAEPGTPAARLLVVDDEPAVRHALERALRLEGYEVATAVHGADALSTMATWQPDALILDILMPIMDGLAVCHSLRAHGDWTPILVLTARDSVRDRVTGLDAGADDYLVKPFALEELLARVRGLLRRNRIDSTETAETLTYADLSLDTMSRKAQRGERTFELTRTECELLELLLRNAERVLSREVILDRVWGYDFGPASNSLEVFIGYLRRKTEAGDEPRLIHTVRGLGYTLRTHA